MSNTNDCDDSNIPSDEEAQDYCVAQQQQREQQRQQRRRSRSLVIVANRSRLRHHHQSFHWNTRPHSRSLHCDTNTRNHNSSRPPPATTILSREGAALGGYESEPSDLSESSFEQEDPNGMAAPHLQEPQVQPEQEPRGGQRRIIPRAVALLEQSSSLVPYSAAAEPSSSSSTTRDCSCRSLWPLRMLALLLLVTMCAHLAWTTADQYSASPLLLQLQLQRHEQGQGSNKPTLPFYNGTTVFPAAVRAAKTKRAAFSSQHGREVTMPIRPMERPHSHIQRIAQAKETFIPSPPVVVVGGGGVVGQEQQQQQQVPLSKRKRRPNVAHAQASQKPPPILGQQQQQQPNMIAMERFVMDEDHVLHPNTLHGDSGSSNSNGQASFSLQSVSFLLSSSWSWYRWLPYMLLCLLVMETAIRQVQRRRRGLGRLQGQEGRGRRVVAASAAAAASPPTTVSSRRVVRRRRAAEQRPEMSSRAMVRMGEQWWHPTSRQ